jgi:hypothetical protein
MNSTVFSEHPQSVCANVFHEAGHAVALHHFGGTIKEIVIGLWRDGMPADSEVRHESPNIATERLLNVALAGPLAERKCRACEEIAKQPERRPFHIEAVRWDRSDKMCDFIQVLRSWREGPREICVYLSLYLPESQEPLRVRVPVYDNRRDLEIADHIYRKHFGDTLPNRAAQEADLQKRLVETRDLLKEPTIWKRVTALAGKLLSDDARGIFLSGERAIWVIEHA